MGKSEPDETDLQRKAKWIVEEAKTLPKPLSCVFCKNAKVDLSGELDRLDAFWISCDYCLCRGPFGMTPKEAIDGWNTRVTHATLDKQPGR